MPAYCGKRLIDVIAKPWALHFTHSLTAQTAILGFIRRVAAKRTPRRRDVLPRTPQLISVARERRLKAHLQKFHYITFRAKPTHFNISKINYLQVLQQSRHDVGLHARTALHQIPYSNEAWAIGDERISRISQLQNVVSSLADLWKVTHVFLPYLR